jgi:hypothetical protein
MLMMRNLIIVFALAAFSISCKSIEPKWIEFRTDDVDAKTLHEQCLLAMTRNDLKVSESDSAEGTIVSAWDVHLLPFFRPQGEGRGGFRRRAHIEVSDADIGSEEKARLTLAGRPLPKWIRVRVERERNDEMTRPAEPEHAQWKEDTDDEALAYRIATMLQNQVRPFEPSDDFKRRFGGSSADPQPKNPPNK